jgi:hypothetical protein
MVPAINDLPYWARDLARQVRDHQENERKRSELFASWDQAVAAHKSRGPRVAVTFAQAATKREATAQFVDLIHAFASAVLAVPHGHTAHATTFALGLLDEITAYTRAEMAATKGDNNV